MSRLLAVGAVMVSAGLLAGCGGSSKPAALTLQDRQAAQACAQVAKAAADTGLAAQVDLQNAENYAQLAAVDPAYAGLPSAISDQMTAVVQLQDPVDKTVAGQCPAAAS